MAARPRINLYVGPKETIDRADLDRFERSGAWLFEVKHDGAWCCVTFSAGRILSIVSRTGLPIACDLIGVRVALAGSGQLCGELVADLVGAERSGLRRIHFFDVHNWNGLDLRDLPQTDRREALLMVFGTFAVPRWLGEPRLYVVEQRDAGILAWYDALLAAGAEGLVGKRKDARARGEGADGKTLAWVRCKPLRTVDYVVIGHGLAEKGTPNLQLGLHRDGKLVKAMECVAPAAIRLADMDALVGRIAELEGREVFPSGALRHGQFKRFRTDKHATDCTYEAALAAGGHR